MGDWFLEKFQLMDQIQLDIVVEISNIIKMENKNTIKVSTATVIDYFIAANNDELNLTVMTSPDHEDWIEIIPDHESNHKICIPKFVLPKLIEILKAYQK